MQYFINSLAPLKNTHEAKIPPHGIEAEFIGGEQGDHTKSISMEQFENKGSSDSDHDVNENTLKTKKMKHQE